MVEIKAYGKINLTLEVLGKRADGYHEIRSIMQNIELHDRLLLTPTEDDSISLEGSNDKLRYDSSNLVYKATEALKKHTGCKKGVSIYLEKRIPLEAGMAGGSADAAAALVGLVELWDLGLGLDELLKIGASLGSDIPFCITGNTALVEGRGELVRSIKSPPNEEILVVKPDFGASTALIYQEFDNMPEEKNVNFTAMMIDAIEKGEDYKHLLHNDLQKVTTSIYPEVQEILDEMSLICETVMMSGSGPTCLAFGNEDQIKKLYDDFSNRYAAVYRTSYKS